MVGSGEEDPAMDDPSTIKMSKAEGDELSRRLETNTLTKEDRALLGRVLEQGLDIVKTESLRSYDGQPGYTLAQGQ